MYYDLVTDLVGLVKLYEQESEQHSQNVLLFGQWLSEYQKKQGDLTLSEPDWLGKSNGRSVDSVINTSLVHLYRYAKYYAKSAIADTPFSTPDDFIYLISLMSFGSMTKTALIKLNVHEKSAGIQIVNRLISNGLAEQSTTDSDKRNRMIHISEKGMNLLTQSMDNIKKASRNVTEPLSNAEKMDLVRLLQKLENFHESKSRA
jgi:DNA-binding MarR family transcriptional regulator